MQREPRIGAGTSRRGLLLGALGVGTATALAACAGPEAATDAGQSSASATTTPPSSPSAEATATPTPEPAAPSINPDEVAAQFAGIEPTEWGLDVTGVVNEVPDASGFDVAITLDACGGPHGSGVDERLLSVLEAEGVAATLFLNLRWIEANGTRAAELAAHPDYLLANHGSAHMPLSVTGQAAYGIAGTTDAAAAVREVWDNHLALTELVGRAPTWFRSGTAHYDEVAVQIVEALGERVAGFSVNGDGGATYSAASVAAEVTSVGPGGIIIAHMNQPDSGTADGFAAAIPQLRALGARFVHLP